MDLQHPRGVQVRATESSVPRYVSDQSYTDRDEAPPLCTGQPAPQSVSPARKNGLSLPALTIGAPCSICYNKSTILASTRDDSIGRGPFLRITRLSRFTSRARCTSHRRDVLGMLLSSPWYPLLPPDHSSERRPFVAGNHGQSPRPTTIEAPVFYGTVVAFERDRAGAKWIWQLEPWSFTLVFFKLIDSIGGDSRARSRSHPLPARSISRRRQ